MIFKILINSPLRIAFSSDTTKMGVFQAKLAIQTTAIILYAWNWVCHLLDFKGLQMAKYLSSDIATKVHTPTETETAEKI